MSSATGDPATPQELGLDRAGRVLREGDAVIVRTGEHAGRRGTVTPSGYHDHLTVTSDQGGPGAAPIVARGDLDRDPGERLTRHAARARELAGEARRAGLGDLPVQDPGARDAGEHFAAGVIGYAADRFMSGDEPAAVAALKAAGNALVIYARDVAGREAAKHSPDRFMDPQVHRRTQDKYESALTISASVLYLKDKALREYEESRRQSEGSVPGLTAEEKLVFDFERTWKGRHAYKESAIYEKLKMDPTQYYDVLYKVIGTVQAYKIDPHLVNRLRKQRELRAARRSPGRGV